MAKNNADIVDKVKESLKNKIVSWEEKNPRRHYFTIKKADILDVVRYLFEKTGARFVTASGVDTPKGIEILYHFSFDRAGGKVVTVKLLTSKEKCQVDSIASIVPGASFIEREIQELLGVAFLDHPDPRPLLTSEDWPEGKYPLRSDYRDTDFASEKSEENK